MLLRTSAIRLATFFAPVLLAACANAEVKEVVRERPVAAAVEKPARDIDMVSRMLKAHANDLYAIYMDALHDEPALRGKVVVEFTIAPSGKVVQARIRSSGLQRPVIEEKLLALVSGLDFGARDVNALVTTFPIDFSPGRQLFE